MPLGRSGENQVGLKLNGTHQLLAYADVNLRGHNIDTTNKNKGSLIDAGKKVVCRKH
jgi:hypothetical protein